MKKVLMLGWEFPPQISGGLGVATQEISKILSAKVDLTLALPFSGKSNDINIVDNLVNTPVQLTENSSRVVIEKIKVEKSISPYHTEYSERESLRTVNEQTTSYNDNYGDELEEQIRKYTDAVLSKFEDKEYDVIYAHDWMTWIAASELSNRINAKFLAHVHSLSFDREGGLTSSLSSQIEQQYLPLADKVICVSRYSAHICVQNYHVDYKIVEVVHNGITHSIGAKMENPFSEKAVLFLGRITKQKGAMTFLDIAENVVREFQNVRFFIAGNGDQLNELIEKSAGSKIADKITFTGFLNQEQVSKVLSITDVYCMPSESEPFGLTTLEAALNNIPCVVSKQAGVREVLKGAVYVDFWNTEDFAARIIELLKDDSLGKKTVQTQNESLNQISWDNTCSRINAIIDQL